MSDPIADKICKGIFELRTQDGREPSWCYWHKDDKEQLFPIAVCHDLHPSGEDIYLIYSNVSHAPSGYKITPWSDDFEAVVGAVETCLALFRTSPEFTDAIRNTTEQWMDLSAFPDEIREKLLRVRNLSTPKRAMHIDERQIVS